MLTRISLLLSVVAAVALVFASDLVVWHVLPRSFLITGVFAFWHGATVSFLAIVLAIVGLVRNGKSKLGIGVCTWCIAEFLAFGLVYLYAAFVA